MRSEVSQALERAGVLPIGKKSLDAYLYGAGSSKAGRAGTGLEYLHRMRPDLSAFALGEAGVAWGDSTQLDWRVLAGIRGVW